jgi:hypothetical protein
MTRVSSMTTAVASTIALAFCSPASRAQETKPLPETLIRLNVTPAREPQPALKYHLLPELKEMSPGNPIQGYLKCYLGQYRFAFDELSFERRGTLLAMPLEELPGPEVPQFGRGALAQADLAARLDNPDWQILLKLKENGIATLLPDVQGMRALARALQARFRAEVSSGRVDDGIRTAKTMFALARHMGEHPTMIGDLVAIAMARVAIDPFQEMLELPDCPNFYWALTNLPDPFISISTGMDGERFMVEIFFRELDANAPMSAERIQRAIDELGKLDQLIGHNEKDREKVSLRDYLARCTKSTQRMVVARNRLIAGGLPEGRVRMFPPDQLILLDEARECQARFDDFAKRMAFPAWQVEEMTESSRNAVREPAFFADRLVPDEPFLRRAQARLEQSFGLLRHVEALRMYAAEHQAFPSLLSDVKVPLPVDPFSGKPFSYESNGKTAHIRGTPPRNAKDNAALRLHYEVTLRN